MKIVPSAPTLVLQRFCWAYDLRFRVRVKSISFGSNVAGWMFWPQMFLDLPGWSALAFPLRWPRLDPHFWPLSLGCVSGLAVHSPPHVLYNYGGNRARDKLPLQKSSSLWTDNDLLILSSGVLKMQGMLKACLLETGPRIDRTFRQPFHPHKWFIMKPAAKPEDTTVLQM